MVSVLPLLQEIAGQADVLFFNGLWDGLEIVDAALPRLKYLWGFPVAGGGYSDGKLDAALLDEVRLGEIDGQVSPRLERIAAMFREAGLKVDLQPNIQHWLWVHFAINCGIIAAAFRAGGAGQLLNSIPNLRLGILAGREALAVCARRGVDTRSFPDAKSFYTPALLGAAAVWLMMKTNGPARKIMERHTAVDELQHMVHDLLLTAAAMKIDMPYFRSMMDAIDHPNLNGPAS
jgi:2-dehydropantoate 2-reductase